MNDNYHLLYDSFSIDHQPLLIGRTPQFIRPRKCFNTFYCPFWTSNSSNFLNRKPGNSCTTLMVLATLTLIGLPLYFYCTFYFYLGDATHPHNLKNLQKSFRNSSNPQEEQLPLLINTSTCVLADYPLFDEEITRSWYVNRSGEEYPCKQDRPPFKIYRLNYTWIAVDLPNSKTLDANWTCFARELFHTGNSWDLGAEEVGPLGRLHNFAHNLTFDFGKELNDSGRWDSVSVTCRLLNSTYSRVVPLVQRYLPKVLPDASSKQNFNVLLLGLDSISRLNFLRHLPLTAAFLKHQGFQEMTGHHKVGENSFPNVVPMLTGRPGKDFYDSSLRWKTKFDDVPFIWKRFQSKGYLTTFWEDMPAYGFFHSRGGFRHQPTEYYSTPVNMALWKQLYSQYTCYQDMVENEYYLQYLLDLLKSFSEQGNASSTPHFTFAHLSTLTHNYFNHAGYADGPYHRFLSALFAQNLQNTVILFYADHHLRFGGVTKTISFIYESRLPFFYVYIPDSLILNGQKAPELRRILAVNAHRLTSHYDLHATMLHVLEGQPPERNSTEEPFGVSLLTEVPDNRTCPEAGIADQYCLCNDLRLVNTTFENEKLLLWKIAFFVVDHINKLLESSTISINNSTAEAFEKTPSTEASAKNSTISLCVHLKLKSISEKRVFSSVNRLTRKEYRTVSFTTMPGGGIFESMVEVRKKRDLESQNFTFENPSPRIFTPVTVTSVTRTNAYAGQSDCVKGRLDIVAFCYCSDLLLKKKEDKKKG